MSLFSGLKGYKTYIVSAVAALTGIIGYFHGTQSFSTALTSAPGLLVFLGGLATTLRAGIKKVELAINDLIAKLPKSVQAKVNPVVTKVETDVNKVVNK
jgi:hypothetical protein